MDRETAIAKVAADLATYAQNNNVAPEEKALGRDGWVQVFRARSRTVLDSRSRRRLGALVDEACDEYLAKRWQTPSYADRSARAVFFDALAAAVSCNACTFRRLQSILRKDLGHSPKSALDGTTGEERSWLLRAAGVDAKWSEWLFLHFTDERRHAGELPVEPFAPLVTSAFVQRICDKNRTDTRLLFRGGEGLAQAMIHANPSAAARSIGAPWYECVVPNEKRRDAWPRVMWDWPSQSTQDEIARIWRIGNEDFFSEMLPILAYQCAVLSGEDVAPEDDNALVAALGPIPLPPLDARSDLRLRAHARVWAALVLLARLESKSWERRTEILGAEALLLRFASSDPTMWAEMLPHLLRRALDQVLKRVDDVTLILGASHPEVREALQGAAMSPLARVRDRARGLMAQVEGLAATSEEAAIVLRSALARYVDGRPAFPHPLSTPSSTWMASLDVEQILRAKIQEAAVRFSADARERLGEDEEPLTTDLLKEINVAFRGTRLRLSALVSAGSRMPVALDASYRQLPKKEEEPLGFDVAILVKGRVPGAFDLVSAELIQVKKPVRGSGSVTFRDAWSIDIPQLRNILAVSQTAGYWLIDPDGVAHVVPARLLLALIRGAGKETQGSRTIHYADIRSMAIPLASFLTDLVFGAWIGTSTAEAIAIVEGNVRDRRPRHLLEVTLSHGSPTEDTREPP